MSVYKQPEVRGGAMTVIEQYEERGGAITVIEQYEEREGAMIVFEQYEGRERVMIVHAQYKERSVVTVVCEYTPRGYFGIRSNPVLPQQHVKDPGHSAESAAGRLQLNTYAPYVCGFA